MKKLIFLLSMVLFIANNIYAQTVVSDNMYVYSTGSDHFNNPGVHGVFNYGVNTSTSEAYVDLMLFQPSVNNYPDDHDITYMETYINIYDEYDNLIASDYGNIYSPGIGQYIATNSYIHKGISIPSGAAKIVCYYWIDSQDPDYYYDPNNPYPNPPIPPPQWVVAEDREIVISLP